MLRAILSRLSLSIFLSHFPTSQVNLIPNEDLNGIWSLVLLEHLIPDSQIFKRGKLGNIIDHDCAISVLHVVGNETTEALLAGSVPELDAKLSSVASHVLDVEIDAHSRLYEEALTFRPYSNRSLMYFSMIDDLPTDWSPRKIILYLVRPPPTVDDDMLITSWIIANQTIAPPIHTYISQE